MISVRERNTGAKIHDLNVIRDELKQPMPITQIPVTEKVNVIRRHGKWVFVGQQNKLFGVFDIHQSDMKIPLHAFMAEGPVRTVIIDSAQSTIYLGVEVQTKESNVGRLQAIIWTPKWEEFGGYDSHKQWKHQVQILKQEKKGLLRDLEELKLYVKSMEEECEHLLAENIELKKELEREKFRVRLPESARDFVERLGDRSGH